MRWHAFRKLVLETHPEARCLRIETDVPGLPHPYAVEVDGRILGQGRTRMAAWIDAAGRTLRVH